MLALIFEFLRHSSAFRDYYESHFSSYKFPSFPQTILFSLIVKKGLLVIGFLYSLISVAGCAGGSSSRESKHPFNHTIMQTGKNTFQSSESNQEKTDQSEESDLG